MGLQTRRHPERSAGLGAGLLSRGSTKMAKFQTPSNADALQACKRLESAHFGITDGINQPVRIAHAEDKAVTQMDRTAAGAGKSSESSEDYTFLPFELVEAMQTEPQQLSAQAAP